MSAIAAGLAAIVAAFFFTLPSKPRTLTGAEQALAARTARGAFHVHTTKSDGVGDKASVAAAARDAGLQFVMFTDHGDGLSPLDPPEYIAGVLCLDGVEISTDGGHYIALGASPSPYPLAGESAAVVEDVARLGGFGVAAHPGSPRAELAWSDWSLPIDGVEWLNADSEWRDERRLPLARAFASYAVRPAASLATLLDRPAATLQRWDAVAAARRVVGVAGHDAHGGIGNRIEDASRRWSVGMPSYRASFRAFSTRVELERPFSGDPRADGAALLGAFRAGRMYSEIDAIASGATFEFTGEATGERVGQGSALRGAGSATFRARATPLGGASTIAFRNGVEIARAAGTVLAFQSPQSGAFRIEIHVDGAPGTPPVPWIVSNPIFRFLDTPAPAEPRERSVAYPLREATWRIEKSDGSEGTVRVGAGGEVEYAYRLRGGPPASQFVALVADLPKNLPEYGAVTLTAQALAPARLSVQLRFAEDAHGRWRTSVYVDPTVRPLVVGLDELRRADGPPQRPDARRATSLLFVVDLTNARPGDSGTITLRDVGLAR